MGIETGADDVQEGKERGWEESKAKEGKKVGVKGEGKRWDSES